MAIIPNFPQDLLDEHHAWHQPGAHGLAGRNIPQGFPGSGLEFLTFHREYLADFHAWYDTQPGADLAAVAPWRAIPPELQDPPLTGWSTSWANQVRRITSNNPRFNTADELGIYIENGIHGWLHVAASLAYNERIIRDLHSPTSTYFYQIHGLVDYWWSRWQRAQRFVVPQFPDRVQIIKNLIDNKGKEAIKDVKEKEVPDKGPKEKEFPDKGPKEKDKDLVEGIGRPDLGGDINFQVNDLGQRLARLENDIAVGRGQAFIRFEERPDVGGDALHDDDDGHGDDV